LQIAETMVQQKTLVVTTRAVMLEIGNSLAGQRDRAAAADMLDQLDNDQAVEVVSLTDGLFRQASELFRKRADKSWSLTDCVSFVVMEQMQLVEALTADHHFVQAGFTALLI